MVSRSSPKLKYFFLTIGLCECILDGSSTCFGAMNAKKHLQESRNDQSENLLICAVHEALERHDSHNFFDYITGWHVLLCLD